MSIVVKTKKSGEGSFTDRSSQIRWDSLAIRQAITKEVDSANFTLEKFGSKNYKPEAGDGIIIEYNSVKVFAGFIVRVMEGVSGRALIYECECRDYTDLLDDKLVSKTYAAQTIAQIISDIVSNFSGPGITTNNVSGTETVDSITFDNLEPSKCIQKLADIFNKDWYIDYDKDIHFFKRGNEAAPFGLTDAGNKYIFDSLKISRDKTQIKNSIIIEGGEEKSTSTFTEKFIGDGNQHTFKLAYKYADVSLKINSIDKTVGIDGIDDFTTKDALFNYQMQTLRFNPSSPPASGAVIEFTGKYYFPIVTKVREANSITNNREKQFRIIERKIKDRDTARERAKAEIYAYANQLSEGEFRTYETGLRAGHKINIQSDIRSLNEDFLINNLEGKALTPQKIEWRANLVSVKTYEIIDLLGEIFNKQNDDIDPNQIINSAEFVERTLKITRTITVASAQEILRNLTIARVINNYIDNPPTWVAGNYQPTGSSDRKRPAFADQGCLLGS